MGITGSNGKTTTREMIHHILHDTAPCKRSPRNFNTDVGALVSGPALLNDTGNAVYHGPHLSVTFIW